MMDEQQEHFWEEPAWSDQTTSEMAAPAKRLNIRRRTSGVTGLVSPKPNQRITSRKSTGHGAETKMEGVRESRWKAAVLPALVVAGSLVIGFFVFEQANSTSETPSASNTSTSSDDTPPESADPGEGEEVLADLEAIEFEVNSDEITAEGALVLEQAAKFFTSNPDMNVVVSGHTDTDGPESFNQELSQRRAESVVDMLVESGLERERFQPLGFGESSPVLVNGTEDKEASRRIEFVVVGDDNPFFLPPELRAPSP